MRDFEPRHGWKVRRDAVLTPAQVAAIHVVLDRWRADVDIDRRVASLLFRFLLRVPLRISEALALRQRDVVAAGVPYLRVRRLKKRERNVVDELPLPEDLRDEILAWSVALPRDAAAVFYRHDPGNVAISRFTAVRRLRACCDAAGVLLPNHCAVHVLRHTAATQLLRRTGNLRLVQSLLGHESVLMTMGYTHVAQDEELAAMSGLWESASGLDEREKA